MGLKVHSNESEIADLPTVIQKVLEAPNILGNQITAKVIIYSKDSFQKQPINRDVFRQTKVYYKRKRKQKQRILFSFFRRVQNRLAKS